jgi:hypothetical protein
MGAGLDVAIVDFGILGTFDLENAQQTAFRPRERMIDQNVVPRIVNLKLRDRGTTGGNGDRLHPLHRGA